MIAHAPAYRRVHPKLRHVADAWFTDGQDAYHVHMYAPHEEWLDGAIRDLVYTGLTFKGGDGDE